MKSLYHGFVAGVASPTTCDTVTNDVSRSLLVSAAPVMRVQLPFWSCTRYRLLNAYRPGVRVFGPVTFATKPVIESCKSAMPQCAALLSLFRRSSHPAGVPGSLKSPFFIIQSRVFSRKERCPMHWSTIHAKVMSAISPGTWSLYPLPTSVCTPGNQHCLRCVRRLSSLLPGGMYHKFGEKGPRRSSSARTWKAFSISVAQKSMRSRESLREGHTI